MSMANPIAKTLADGEIKILPCGIKTLFISPAEDSATYDLEFGADNGCEGVKDAFNWDFGQPLRSATANPAKITAHGKVHLIYSL